jgi:hypothetical protein
MNIFDLNIFSEEKPVSLLNRTKLKSIRESMIEQIEIAPTHSIFRLDMEQIGDANGSGIDEVIAKPLKWVIEQYNNKQCDKYLFLENLSPEEEYDHAYNIKSTFNIEQLCIMVKKNESYSILGYIGGNKNSLKEVLEFVYDRKKVTARDVVDVLGKQLNTASTQLSKLSERRLISRKEVQIPEGGRQFIYESLF